MQGKTNQLRQFQCHLDWVVVLEEELKDLSKFNSFITYPISHIYDFLYV